MGVWYFLRCGGCGSKGLSGKNDFPFWNPWGFSQQRPKIPYFSWPIEFRVFGKGMDMISGKKMYHITYVRGSIRKYYRDQYFSYKTIDRSKKKNYQFPCKKMSTPRKAERKERGKWSKEEMERDEETRSKQIWRDQGTVDEEILKRGKEETKKTNPQKRRRKGEKHVRKTGREASRQAGATKEWRKEQEKEANKIRKARVYVLILSIFPLIRYKQAWSNSSNWSNNYGYQLVASCFKKTAGTWLSELSVWQKPKQKKTTKTNRVFSP